jgi:hypothetical protein
MSSEYAYQGSILPPLSGRQCLSPLSSGQVITAKTGAIGPNNFTDTTATITASDVGVWGNQLNGFVFGNAIVTATPAGASQTSSNLGVPTPIKTGTESQITSTPTPTHSSSSILSTTAGKVGIFVGISLGAVVLCCFIGIILLYRRRASRLHRQFAELESKAPPTPPTPPTPAGPPPPRPPPPPQELWSPVEKEYRYEVETKEKPVEMWAGGLR